ncbi:peptidoglycan/LPS O-acetylase OafA/YrhL/lysophospholipase L1-like esterase [Paenibacillus sp. LBL]|uniref:acyltransferase family protein n=1 Tax=Paenibacillus sp. LBL TaxID=2940563 RepID=UPI0024758D45|nr:acyltransferase family protein [Paenibacillus sp. LBL]MDH6670276.1 peptidoglycan/LPS O-acetylase OafA/YrhL/lysophospholipase L1-like esterase [Paenibacillus sp. LBL]
MPISDKPHSRYMPGLDGLRALALIGVMGYHWNFGFAGGGFLGVSLFFVLSGYLITDILASQWHHQRRIDLKDFWIRRFRRLLPAMLLMLFILVVWVTLFDRSRLLTLRGEVLGAVTYISNWQFIYQQQSYFESFGPPSPLGHFWSLAVEEQFYLLWPLIMLAGLKLFPRRGQLFSFIAAGAAASALVMALIYQPGEDPSRVYYGTDTRAFGLLIGAGLAIVWPSWKLSLQVSTAVRRRLNLTGAAALLIILFMMWQVDRYDPFLYRGGMFLFSMAAAVLVAVLAHPAASISRLLSWKPLLWVGVRSYGIYLWHYPVMILTSPASGSGDLSLPQVVLQITASVILAALSWKYVEEPIRHGGLKKLWLKVRSVRRRPASISLRGWIVSLSSLILIGIFCTGMMSSVSDARTVGDIAAMLNIENTVLEEPEPSQTEESSPDVPPQGQQRNPVGTIGNITPPADVSSMQPEATREPSSGDDTKKDSLPDTEAVPGNNDSIVNEDSGNALPAGDGTASHQTNKVDGSSETTDSGNNDKTGKEIKSENPPQSKDSSDGSADGKDPNHTKPVNKDPQARPSSKSTITAIGDSVMLGVSPYLEKSLPGIHIDAVIGRQMRQADDLVPALKAQNRIDGGIIIIGLGTNGAFSKKDLDSLLRPLDSAKQIVLVNTRVPRDWEQNVNDMLAKAAAENPKVTLVDWYSASKDHPEYFRSDSVHLEPEGAAAYTSMLLQSIKK